MPRITTENLSATFLNTSGMPQGILTATDFGADPFEEIVESVQNIQDDNKVSKKCIICGNKKQTKTLSFRYYRCRAICNDCVNNFFEKCDSCEMWYDKRKMIFFEGNNKKLCHKCVNDAGFKKCHKCQEYKYHQVVDINNEYLYCIPCIEKDNNFFRCVECGRYYKKERYGENECCISCVNARLREVRNYSYKPEPRFFKKNSEMDNLYFGVELEMGCVKDPEYVNEFVAEYSNNFFYMKKDTSIPIYGCEIVTQPATLSKHITSNYWKPLLESAKDYGFRADHEKCGIHIHISKNVFTNDEIAKLDCFVNSYPFWKKLARRESHYSEYVLKNSDSWGMQTTNRRCALNLSNENTIEFRIFKGTLEYEEVMAYLEACYAAAYFIKQIQSEDLEKNKKNIVDKFISFIKNEKRFLFLWNYCDKYEVFY